MGCAQATRGTVALAVFCIYAVDFAINGGKSQSSLFEKAGILWS